MKFTPTPPPGAPPHQIHAYQGWQGTPAYKIFMNDPENSKWHVGFKEGGKGGPTKDEPYTVMVQLKEPTILTHFTMTTNKSQPVLPDRDPREWAIQGSRTENGRTSMFARPGDERTVPSKPLIATSPLCLVPSGPSFQRDVSPKPI